MFIIVHVPGIQGSLIFKSYTVSEAQFMPGFLSMLVEDYAEVIITNVPAMFMEYAPFQRIRDKIDFINAVLKLVPDEKAKRK